MNLTIQTHSESGSFACPNGRQSLRHCSCRAEAALILEGWADVHARYGCDEHDATALVWRGHLKDVTDRQPDWQLCLGPRLGVQWHKC